MIKSFKCKETEKIFKREYSEIFLRDIQKVALRKLWMLDAATDLNSLQIPLDSQETDSNYYRVVERDNLVFELTNNGGFVLSGGKMMRLKWK